MGAAKRPHGARDSDTGGFATWVREQPRRSRSRPMSARGASWGRCRTSPAAGSKGVRRAAPRFGSSHFRLTGEPLARATPSLGPPHP